MSNNSLVSIALCTYNGERFLKKQLDSILEQTYSNFELIIVDDCSTDNTINIINEYLKKDTRIKLYKNIKNLGFIKNFDKAISLCNGEFICLCDQDDIWNHSKIEILLNKIDNNVLIYSNALLIDENDNSLNKTLVDDSKIVEGNNNRAFILNNCVSGNTLMFKKELVKYILPIPQYISLHDIWIAFVASTYGNIKYINDNLVQYRRYEDQITANKSKQKKEFVNRIDKKMKQKLKYSKKHLNNMNAFLSLEILKDKETILILQELKKHFEYYENIFYNKKLAQTLQKYKDDIFILVDNKKVNRDILKISTGMKFHKYTLFST